MRLDIKTFDIILLFISIPNKDSKQKQVNDSNNLPRTHLRLARARRDRNVRSNKTFENT